MNNNSPCEKLRTESLSLLSTRESLKGFTVQPSHGSSQYRVDFFMGGGMKWDERLSEKSGGNWVLESMKNPNKKTNTTLIALVAWGAIVIIVLMTLLLGCVCSAHAELTQASYYTRASCSDEGTSGIMANGEKLDDTKRTGASWCYPLGTKVKVRNLRNGREVILFITDRGPSKKLFKRGRRLDLSKASFEAIEPNLKVGVIWVEIEKIS